MIILISLLPAFTLAYSGQGDNLVKVADSSAVYVFSGLSRYVFPDLKTYQSWYGHDFSAVQTVSPTILAAYQLAGNVTHKPGSLIKIQTDPKVYEVLNTDGDLDPIADEQEAASRFGQFWSSLISDIPASFFVNYQITDLPSLPPSINPPPPSGQAGGGAPAPTPEPEPSINPLGLFSLGVGGSYSYTNADLRDYISNTYGSLYNQQYLTQIDALLDQLNLNTVGGLVAEDQMNIATALGVGRPYFASFRLETFLTDPNCSGCSVSGVKFPSMNAEFRQQAEARIASITSKAKNNPNLLGYFTSNELASDQVSDALVEEYVDFVLTTARQYDSDLSHLIISDRIGGLGWDPNTPQLQNKIEQFARFDIISINLYPYVNPDGTGGYTSWQLSRLDDLYQITQTPILISEAGIAHQTAQVPTTPSRWQSRLTATDAQRGLVYQTMIDQIIDREHVIGLHYYVWSDVDEPSLAAGSEQVGNGVVKNDLTLYQDFAQAMSSANQQLLQARQQ